MSDEIDTRYYPEGHPAISSAKDQVQAEALDLVREAHSVFIVGLVSDGDDVVAKSLTYGHPILLPRAVQNEASTYLIEAVALIRNEILGNEEQS